MYAEDMSEKRITQLTNSKRGKKGSITKRITQIDRIVGDGGSRSQIKYLVDALLEVKKALQAVCDELVTLSPDTDSEWIDTENLRIDTCVSEAKAYLERRANDPPSTEGLTDSWVDKHAAVRDFESASGGDGPMSHLVQSLSDLQTYGSHPVLSSNSQFAGGFATGVSGTTSIFPLGHQAPNEFLRPAHYAWPQGLSYNLPSVTSTSQFMLSQHRPQIQKTDQPSYSFSNEQLHLTNYNATNYLPTALRPNNAAQMLHRVSSIPSAATALNSLPNVPTFSASVGNGSGLPPPASCVQQQQQQPQQQPQQQQHQQRQQQSVLMNQVDSWIDNLNENLVNNTARNNNIDNDIAMGFFIQQGLPRMTIPTFDGSPLIWVEFITKFRDLVHDQPYLSVLRKSTLLLQHLKDEPRRSVQGFPNDNRGYVMSLKKLKFLFGQRSKIAQAILMKITYGKDVQDDDDAGLNELYYSVSDCLVTLRQLNYASDIYSSDTLRQVVTRLPRRLRNKWSEKSLSIRSNGQDPNLIHLEEWLQMRVLARKEEYHPEKCRRKTKEDEKKPSKFAGKNEMKVVECSFCKKSHLFWKCDKYENLVNSEKFQYAKTKRLCYNCLREGHMTKDCTSRISCTKEGCSDRHHTTLHDFFSASQNKDHDKQDNNSTKNENADEESKSKKPETVHNMMVKSEVKNVFLWVVPVTIRSLEGVIHQTYALLDNGSQSTVIKNSVVEKLCTQSDELDLSVGTMMKDPEEITVGDVTLNVESRDGAHKFKVENVYSVPPSRFKMPSQPYPKEVADPDVYTHLDGVDVSAVSQSQIEILIGADVPEAFIVKEVRRGKKNQPLAVNTVFGWTLFGATRGKVDHTLNTYLLQTSPLSPPVVSVNKLWVGSGSSKDLAVNTSHSSMKPDLEKLVEKFWVQEHTGILPSRDIAMSQEDIEASKQLKNDTKMIDGRYEVPMFWTNPTVKLPNNVSVAQKRFTFLRKRLRADPILHKKYEDTIQQYVQQGKARKMTDKEASQTSDKTWYLPHHPVYNVNKPNKIRVVNDAAAECKGTSLNKSLVTGPDLLNSLVGVLMRFRVGPIAIVADIEAMFHQVLVSKMDTDSLRFLWTDDIDSDHPPYCMQMLVHIFGAKDSLTCAIHALQQTARDNMDNFSALTVETILRAFYVDDLLKSVLSNETAITLVKELIEILKCGGFRLTKWLSNSKTVLQSIPPSEISPNISVELDSDTTERALGISWNVSDDNFTFHFNPKNVVNTKRGILRITSSLFDPLGFLTPFILRAKILLQELWRQNLDWDDEITGEPLHYWQRWLENAGKISSVMVARCYVLLKESVLEIQLHVFCDASENAYGAVAYLRYSFKDGRHQCTLVMSKSKLAPIKTVTLARLELCSCEAGARLSQTILHEIDVPIEQTFFWSDSMLALQYISNTRNRYKVFVANRTSEIRTLSKIEQWSHISGDTNPADLLTRGVNDPSSLMSTNNVGTSWFEGAAFLQKDEEHWMRRVIDPLNSEDPEIKKKSVLVALGLVKRNTHSIDVSRYSNWTKLKRIAGWFLRIVSNLKNKEFLQMLDNWKNRNKSPGDLSCDEIREGELFLIRDVQRIMFEKEIRTMKAGKDLHTRSHLASLTPFIENDIIRVGGRLRRAEISHDSKHPIILPKNHPITELIVMDDHKKNGHVGRDHVLSNLRQHYWIIHGRSAVKSVLRKCFLCRVRRAKQRFPLMSDLPEGRVAWKQPPFSHSGVDLFGPILVKQGRKRLKRWGVLFTCLTIRCVHLEVVESPDTDDFINALRRFVNRRSCLTNMYSDCGTNFKGASAELKEVIENFDKAKINAFATTHKIVWHFNPPAAPHMGGVWERLVKSVKEVLTATMQDRVLTDPQFATALTEVESILNNRPLTSASNDVMDFEALTPNHILSGLHRNWSTILDTDERDILSRRKWRQVQGTSHDFWQRWRKEYLPTLMKRPCWKGRVPNLRSGELVLLKDDSPMKGKWELARVLKPLPGDDDVVRVVELQTKTGKYVRPVAKLFRLEDDEVPQGEGYIDN